MEQQDAAGPERGDRPLARLGVDRDARTDIVLTHFRCDYICNVASFPAAQVVAAENEFAFWTGE